MRVTRLAMETHRTAILQAAGRLFRTRGIDNVSVAEVTRAAGLTHGAFYGHYASKTALAEAACRESLDEAAAKWRRWAVAADAAGEDPVGVIIDRYLTEHHRDSAATGCAVASLGPELSRTDPALHGALSDGVAGLTDALAEAVAMRRPAADAETCRRAAVGVLAALTGGLVLARALTDSEGSRAALAAAAGTARQAADL